MQLIVMDKEINQELIFRASLLERQAQEIQSTLEFIDKQLLELEAFGSDLKSFSKSSERQMLASLGKGIYVKSSLETKDLYVNVGAGVIVKKSPEDAEKIVELQVGKLKEARVQLAAQLESNNQALVDLISEIEKSKSPNPS